MAGSIAQALPIPALELTMQRGRHPNPTGSVADAHCNRAANVQRLTQPLFESGSSMKRAIRSLHSIPEYKRGNALALSRDTEYHLHPLLDPIAHGSSRFVRRPNVSQTVE
jgi:hypothetical protein